MKLKGTLAWSNREKYYPFVQITVDRDDFRKLPFGKLFSIYSKESNQFKKDTVQLEKTMLADVADLDNFWADTMKNNNPS